METNTSVIATHPSPKGKKRAGLRKWVLKLTLVLAIMAPLVFVIAAFGAKIGLFDWKFSLGVLSQKVGPAALVMTGVMGLTSLALAVLIKPRKGFFAAGLALVVAFAGMAKLGGTVAKVNRLPFIHDVTTDTQNVPQFTQDILTARAKVKNVNKVQYAGKRDSRDNELVSVLQTKAYPNVRTLNLSEDPKIVFGKAEAIASELGWKLVTRDVETGIIEAVDTSFWYGFKDDVIIRITQGDEGVTLVDVRSLSRVGQSDLGKNASRIKSFLNKLKTA